ncbi:MAG: PTS sugar transporter subunit IIA [Acidobacteriota bacterium]
MFLTVAEAAQRLGVPEATVRRWLRQGKLPARVMSGDFSEAVGRLEKWAADHHLIIHQARPTGTLVEPPPPDLGEALERGGLVSRLGGSDVRTVLEGAVAHLPLPPGVARTQVLERILRREAMASTGIGRGVAIPHPRSPVGDGSYPAVITACLLTEAVDFAAVDGQKVFALFVMLSPTVTQHLELLSQISCCLRDDRFITSLGTCREVGDLCDLARDARPCPAE